MMPRCSPQWAVGPQRWSSGVLSLAGVAQNEGVTNRFASFGVVGAPGEHRDGLQHDTDLLLDEASSRTTLEKRIGGGRIVQDRP